MHILFLRKKVYLFHNSIFVDRRLELDFGDGKSTYIINKGQCLILNKHCYVFNNPEERDYFAKEQSLVVEKFELPKQKEEIMKSCIVDNTITMTVSLSKRSKERVF